MASSIFFDFEYEDSIIISVGMVAEPAGSEDLYLYLEADLGGKSIRTPFVCDTVMPLLEKPDSEKRSKGEIASSIRAFASMYANPIFVCDSDIDAGLLQSLVPEAVVQIVRCADYAEQQLFEEAYTNSHDEVLAPRHHALHDARALRAGVTALNVSRGIS